MYPIKKNFVKTYVLYVLRILYVHFSKIYTDEEVQLEPFQYSSDSSKITGIINLRLHCKVVITNYSRRDQIMWSYYVMKKFQNYNNLPTESFGAWIRPPDYDRLECLKGPDKFI